MKQYILHCTFLIVLLLSLPSLATNYSFVPNKRLEFSWQTDDKICVASAPTNNYSAQQLIFWASSSAGSSRNERAFYATGFSLKDNTTYYSFYPYVWFENFDISNVAFSYLNQKQTSNNSTSHLYNYDYSISKVTTTSSTSCRFTFNRICSIVRVVFSAPESLTATSLSLSTAVAAIPSGQLVNLSNQTSVNQGFTNQLSLVFNDFSLAKGETATAYLSLPPVDLSSENLTVSLTSSTGKTYELATIKAPNLKAGYLYNIDLVSTPSSSKDIEEENVAFAKIFDNNLASEITSVSRPTGYASDIPLDPSFRVEYITPVLVGDVNNDGVVDIVDAIALNGYYLNGRTADLDKRTCDINNDGIIDIVDVISITSKYIEGQ